MMFMSDNEFTKAIYLMLCSKKQRFQSIENPNVVTLQGHLKLNKVYLALEKNIYIKNAYINMAQLHQLRLWDIV